MSTEHLPTDQSGPSGTNIQLPRVDDNEFEEAFAVFSDGCPYIMKDNLPLFLKSIGLGGLKIEDAVKKHNNELDINELRQIIDSVIATQCDVNQSCADIREWPSHLDVLRAFAVFDQEGHGYIPVQQLKRFLLQAQLGFQEEELERLIREMCDIDNDNQIDYEKFVRNVETRLQAVGIKR